MKRPKRKQNEERILVFAPTGRDAELAATVLAQADIAAHVCRGMEALCREIKAGAGAVLLTEEALDEAATQLLFRTLDQQPPWSDLPLLLFAGSEPSADLLLATIGTRANVTILERPIRITTIVSAARAALRMRLRQYQARDLLHRLKQADRQKDMFLAMLGHELRNPLNTVSNALYILDQVSSQDEQPVRLRTIIKRQVRQLARLVDDLLDVSRITSGKITLQKQPLDLNEVAERCVQTQRLNDGDEHHLLTLTPAPQPVIVEGDAARLEQIVDNLISNAIKYTPKGGHINLSIAREGQEAVVRVQDDGIGIAPEMLTAVFDLFTQAEHTLDRARGGLGLGLTLVRQLVEKHAGTVTAQSPGIGQGSEFTVRLPLHKQPAPAPTAPRPSTPRARHILIVEDNADGRESLQFLLKMQGHQVDVAEDGQQGVEMILTLKPDVAVVDIGLPLLDGYQVSRQVRAAPDGDKIFLVALSGYGRPEDRQRVLEAGFNAHLVKPLDLVQLTGLLNSLPPNGTT